MNFILKLVNTPVGGAICFLFIYVVIHYGTGIARKLKKAKVGPVEIELTPTNCEELSQNMLATIDRHFDKKFGVLEQGIKQVRLDTMRLQILSDSTNKAQKCHIYDEYIAFGGNSYIKDFMREYLEEN